MGQIVLDHDDLARRLRNLRSGGKQVIVTNGCFDLLHVGHIRCITDAARRGDCLVVALNSDESVRRLKGEGRPFQPEMERVEILAAITGVDYVTLFSEDSVGPLLRKLRPTMLAKGTDYTLDTLPEKAVLAEIGAELVIAGDPKEHSTHDLLDRVVRAGTKAAPPGKPVAKAKALAPAKGASEKGSAPKVAMHRSAGQKPGHPAKAGGRSKGTIKAAPAPTKASSAAIAAASHAPKKRKKGRGAAEAQA